MASGHRRHFADPHMLLKMQYNSTATHVCDICRSRLAGLSGYRCSACDFDVHEACADYFKETISFFAHPWHELTLTRMPSSSIRWICDLCREECPMGTFVYRCVRCDFDVHPLCTMLPQTIRSPLDPAHELCMVPSTSGSHCSACDEGLSVWRYCCGFCRLKLHIACASGAEQGGAAAATGPQTTGTGGGAAAATHPQTTGTGGGEATATRPQSQTTGTGGGAAAATRPQTTGTGSGGGAQSNAAVVGRPNRSIAVVKFLLKTSFHLAIHAATGGLASPVLEMLAAAWN